PKKGWEYCNCPTCTDYRKLKAALPILEDVSTVTALPNTHDGWSPWTAWSVCYSVCLQYRTRSCIDPQQQTGQINCHGENEMSRKCTDGNCRGHVDERPNNTPPRQVQGTQKSVIQDNGTTSTPTAEPTSPTYQTLAYKVASHTEPTLVQVGVNSPIL
ncbi:unnamed protein product, partial [Meganyctiphanes norvegica]